MAVRLRFQRRGAKKKPHFRLVAIEQGKRRNGSALEILGFYQPQSKRYFIDWPKVKVWLARGAQPTASVKHFLKRYKSEEKATSQVNEEEKRAASSLKIDFPNFEEKSDSSGGEEKVVSDFSSEEAKEKFNSQEKGEG